MEIANITGFSNRTVRYWMDKYQIKRRSYSEAVYLKLNPNGDPFKIKQKLDPEAARNHWAKELKISRQKFGKITQIPTQGRGTYKKKSKFGVCTVQANNVKLRAWMMEQISSLQEKLLI